MTSHDHCLGSGFEFHSRLNCSGADLHPTKQLTIRTITFSSYLELAWVAFFPAIELTTVAAVFLPMFTISHSDAPSFSEIVFASIVLVVIDALLLAATFPIFQKILRMFNGIAVQVDGHIVGPAAQLLRIKRISFLSYLKLSFAVFSSLAFYPGAILFGLVFFSWCGNPQRMAQVGNAFFLGGTVPACLAVLGVTISLIFYPLFRLYLPWRGGVDLDVEGDFDSRFIEEYEKSGQTG